MGQFAIAVLGGDGIGPEVTAEAVAVLDEVGRRFGHHFTYSYCLVGQAAIDEEGAAISEATIAECAQSDAVLFGAVGGAMVLSVNATVQPEQAILRLRQALGLFANLRPVRPFTELTGASTLRPEHLVGVDLLVVRELTGGIYFGKPSMISEGPEGAVAIDTMVYSEGEIERVVRAACEFARERRKVVTSVDKANVLQCSKLWRRVAQRVATEYPDVQLRHMLVDSCAMALIRQPAEFDVIVTENLFGDILTDEAAMIVGSLGLLPSASLGTRTTAHGRFGLYEPIHGSAPDIAGRGIANPIAAILSAAMLLRHSLSLEAEATAVEAAVAEALATGLRTADIAMPDERHATTHELGAVIADGIRAAH